MSLPKTRFVRIDGVARQRSRVQRQWVVHPEKRPCGPLPPNTGGVFGS